MNPAGASGSEGTFDPDNEFVFSGALVSEDAGESESPSPNWYWTDSVGGLGFLGDDVADRLLAERLLSEDSESELGLGSFPKSL